MQKSQRRSLMIKSICRQCEGIVSLKPHPCQCCLFPAGMLSLGAMSASWMCLGCWTASATRCARMRQGTSHLSQNVSALVLGLWLARAFNVAVGKVLDEVADRVFTGALRKGGVQDD